MLFVIILATHISLPSKVSVLAKIWQLTRYSTYPFFLPIPTSTLISLLHNNLMVNFLVQESNPLSFSWRTPHILRVHSNLSNLFNLPVYQTCNHIGLNIIFATRIIAIFSFYRIENQIGSHHVLNQGTHSTFLFIKLCN